MTALARTDALYALGLALWSGWSVVRGSERPPAHAGALIVLEAGLVLLAALGVVELLGGDVAEPATLAGYLFAAVVILPAAASGALDRRSRWDSAVLGMACCALSVVATRIVAVGGG